MLARMMDGTSPLMRLQGQMNRMLENFFDDAPVLRGYGASYPAMNLWQDGDTAYAETELPGLNMEEIEVFVSGKELTINGERKIATPEKATYHRRERASGRFTRVLTLPWEIDADKVQAKFDDGVLTIALPKSESCKPKKVNVISA
jgi:HSP20 family protein